MDSVVQDHVSRIVTSDAYNCGHLPDCCPSTPVKDIILEGLGLVVQDWFRLMWTTRVLEAPYSVTCFSASTPKA